MIADAETANTPLDFLAGRAEAGFDILHAEF